MTNPRTIETYILKQQEIGSKYVEPSLKNFYETNSLNFNGGWKNANEFDLERSKKELKIEPTALECFNALNHRLIVHGDKIIKYKFTSLGGEFSFEEYDFDVFFNHHFEISNILKESIFIIERIQKIMATILILGYPYLIIYIINNFSAMSLPKSIFLIGLSIFTLIGAKFIFTSPELRRKNKIAEYHKKIDVIKQNLSSQ